MRKPYSQTSVGSVPYGAAYGYRGGYYGYPGYARDCSGYGYGPNSPCYP